MSTCLNDVASAARLASGLAPSQQTANVNGSTVDMIDADGPCFAVQHVGAVSGGVTVEGRMEESTTGSSWSAISGATFTAVTTANDVQVITFTRTARYVRWAADIDGETPTAQVAVLIGEQKKTI
jgi:hypothetical protein